MQDAQVLFFAIFVALLFPKSGIDGVRYNFLVDWYDNEASLVRKFNLFYYTSNDFIELVEVKNRRTFLKKIRCEGVSLKSIYVGSTINVFSRQMKIVDYGDLFTKDHFSSQTERTFALMKPESLKYLGKIVDEIYSRGFKITQAKMCLITEDQAKEFYKEHEGRSFFLTLVRHMSSEPVVAMELMGKDAVRAWRREIGPTDVEVAQKEAPSSLRALFGINKTQNGFHGSDSLESAQRELELFFPSDTSSGKVAPKTTATFVNCTCCVVKPHAIEEGNLGKILTHIQSASFQITALRMFYLEHADVEEFYEVYKGVVPEYNGMVGQLISGPSVALEIKDASSNSKEEITSRFRILAGPSDPEIAQKLRPHSIRAKFGRTKVNNAVHCTDLPEDGLLEVEYFFKILE